MSKTTETPTITDFLLARIAEDEAVAEEYIMEFGGVWSPERILSECEAKRRIVERAVHIESMHDYSGSFTIADLEFDERILPALASVYADHPDYRDEWR